VALGASYTLDQLRGLRFVPAAQGTAGSADLAWVVRDDGGTARGGVDQTAGSVKIAVVPQAPANTVTPVAPASPPTAPTAPTTQPIAPAPSAPAAVTPVAQARPAGEGGGLGLGDALPPLPVLAPASEFGFAVQRAVDVPEGARAPGMGPRLANDLVLAGFNAAAGGEFLITGLNGMGVSAARLTIDQFQQTLRSGAFIEELNRLRKQMHDEFDIDRTTSITVAGLSLGVSVVYILWLIRGGVLLGSYLSALPAWRLLDPLPVLARAGDDEDEDEDDEAFEPAGDRGPDPLRGFA